MYPIDRGVQKPKFFFKLAGNQITTWTQIYSIPKSQASYHYLLTYSVHFYNPLFLIYKISITDLHKIKLAQILSCFRKELRKSHTPPKKLSTILDKGESIFFRDGAPDRLPKLQ